MIIGTDYGIYKILGVSAAYADANLISTSNLKKSGAKAEIQNLLQAITEE